MNRYFIHTSSNSPNRLDLFYYVNNIFQTKTQIELTDISDHIDSDSEIFYFVPSSNLSSIGIEAIEGDSDEATRAKLLSNMDDYIVSDISENEIFIYKSSDLNLAILISNNYLKDLVNNLRSTGSKIYIYPEHFLGFLKKRSSIFKVADRFIFSFNSGEGFSQTESTVQDYIALVKQERVDFDPKIFSNDEILINAYKSTNLEELTLEDLHSNFAKNYSSLPNLYKSSFSITYWIKRLQINRLDMVIAITALCLTVAYPLVTTYLNNSYADQYKNETVNLFKKINPNIKKVVNPRRQIDEILNSYNLVKTNRISISGMDSLKVLDIPQLTKVFMNVETSEATLTLSELGSNQFKFLMTLLPQSNLILIQDNTEIVNGKVSGTVLIGLPK